MTVAALLLVPTSPECALVLEALKRLKTARPDRWDAVAPGMLEAAREVAVVNVTALADAVAPGTRRSLCSSRLRSPPPARVGPRVRPLIPGRGTVRSCRLAPSLLRTAPPHLQRVVWHELTRREASRHSRRIPRRDVPQQIPSPGSVPEAFDAEVDWPGLL